MKPGEEKLVRCRRLVFGSEVLVTAGQKVRPDTVVAKTMLPLPRLFFLSAFRILPNGSPEGYGREWLVSRGDKVECGTPLVRFYPEDSRDEGDVLPGGVRIADPKKVREFKSPFPGVIEEIREDTGSILLRETLDYGERKAVVYVGQQIGVRGRKLKRYLRRNVGDFVEKGELLAMRVGAADEDNAAFVEMVRAPIGGVVTEIDLEAGSVRLERKFEEVELPAGVFGEVSRLDSSGVEIEFAGRRIFGVCGIGGEACGRIRIINAAPNSELGPDDILESDAGKVLACRAFAGLEAMRRAAECGVSGMVVGGADHLDLCEFLGGDFAVAITGKEKVPFPVILMRGFGRVPTDEETDRKFDLLAEHDGSWVIINGTTHVRAGVVRPEIIIIRNMG